MRNQDAEIHRSRPSLTLKVHRSNVPMVVKVESKKQRRREHGGQHQGAMRGHSSQLDLPVRGHQQYCAGAVECGVDHRKDSVLCWVLHHAAGLVVRRFTIRKASPNMKSENSTSVAIEATSENSPWLAGYKRSRSASTP